MQPIESKHNTDQHYKFPFTCIFFFQLTKRRNFVFVCILKNLSWIVAFYQFCICSVIWLWFWQQTLSNIIHVGISLCSFIYLLYFNVLWLTFLIGKFGLIICIGLNASNLPVTTAPQIMVKVPQTLLYWCVTGLHVKTLQRTCPYTLSHRGTNAVPVTSPCACSVVPSCVPNFM